MRFDENYTYPAGFDKIWAMYGDPKFTELRLAETGLQDLILNVTGTGTNNLEISATGTVSADMIPAQARRFVSGGLKITVKEGWHREGDAANGTLSVDVKGAPVHIKAECTLVSIAADATRRKMVGDLKISIPLLGGRLEKQAIGFVPQLIDGELAAAKKYLQS